MTLVLGTGCLTAHGLGPGPLRDFPSGSEPQGPLAAVEDFDPANYLDRRGLRPVSRATGLALVAANAALDGGVPGVPPERLGAVVGTQWGSIDPLVEFDRSAAVDGPGLVNPSHFPNVVANVHGSYVGIMFGLRGLNVTVCGAGAGLEAVCRAADLLDLGTVDAVLGGGTEALGPSVVRGLERAGEPGLARRPGEGAAFLLLARAAPPGRPALARVAGCATRTALDCAELADARRDAVATVLAVAGVGLGDVDRVWTAGADPSGAGVEVRSVSAACGDCRAAGGAIAAVLAVEEARRGRAALALAFPERGTQVAALLTPVQTVARRGTGSDR